MKMIKSILISGIALLIFACGASQKVKEPNTKLDQMMAEKTFKIKIKTAEPMLTQAMGEIANSGMLAPGNTINRIDVRGSGFFIKVQGDSVSADLPFYGEQQMGGGYDSNAGIKFNGMTNNLTIVKDETKQSYLVNFSINSNTENFFVAVAVGNNLSSTTAVRSSHRNRIRFTGDVVEGVESKE